MGEVICSACNQPCAAVDDYGHTCCNYASVSCHKDCAKKAEALQRKLGNLLAVIHRDGGHYINEHGWGKACADAEARWYELRRKVEEYQERLATTLQEQKLMLTPCEHAGLIADSIAPLQQRITELEQERKAVLWVLENVAEFGYPTGFDCQAPELAERVAEDIAGICEEKKRLEQEKAELVELLREAFDYISSGCIDIATAIEINEKIVATTEGHFVPTVTPTTKSGDSSE